MATKKRASTAKSTTVTKKPVAKKAVAKSAVVKKTVRKSTRQTSNPFAYNPKMKSFAIYNDSAEFLSMRITRQTIYWSALLIYTLCLSLWVLKIQTDILDILNQIH
jgi:hypothetical protein